MAYCQLNPFKLFFSFRWAIVWFARRIFGICDLKTFLALVTNSIQESIDQSHFYVTLCLILILWHWCKKANVTFCVFFDNHVYCSENSWTLSKYVVGPFCTRSQNYTSQIQNYFIFFAKSFLLLSSL